MFMDESAAAWSGLGSSMNLPSAMREEIEQLKLELRDLKLEVARDLMELKETVSSVIGDLVSFVDKQKSLLTRVEGLEARAQGAMPIVNQNDQFNAFAYVSLNELENNVEIEGVFPDDVTSHNVKVQPVGSENGDENEDNEVTDEEISLSEEDTAALFLEEVYAHIDDVGGILNNVLFSKLWKKDEAPSKRVKQLVKDALLADEDIEYHKLSKLRGLYHRTGGDPDAIYTKLYG